MISRKKRQGIISGFFAIALIASSLLSSTVALANTWTGRGSYHGYFDNDYGDSSASPCPGHRGPVLYNDCYKNNAIPGSVNTGTDVYNFLRDTYANPRGNGGKWDRTGSSFIVNTMLGRDPKQATRGVSAGMWSELKERLTASNLKVNVVGKVGPGDYSGDYDTFYQYSQNDIAYYKNNDPDDGKALVFKSGGKTVYVLLYACGNPIGNFNGLPPAPNDTPDPTPTPTPNPTPTPTPTPTPGTTTWKIATDASVLLSGNTITWTHTVENNGPDSTDTSVTYSYVDGNGFTPGTGGAHTYPSGRANGDADTFQSTFTFNPVTDAGRQFCRATQATPRSSVNTGTVTSDFACVTIEYNYQLTPFTKFDDGALSRQVEVGQLGTQVYFGVTNNGPTISAQTDWSLTRCVYATGGPSTLAQTTNGASAAQTYGGACTAAGGGTDAYGVETKNYGPTTEDDTNVTAGTTICYITSVTPPGSGIGGFRHSAPACVKVVKTPKIQALGGDVRAATVITAPARNIGGTFYGSWAEYGIFGVNGISGMGSGGSLAQGGSTNNGNKLNALTFANTPGLGNFFSVAPTDNYYTSYAAQPGPTVGNVAGGVIGNGVREVRHVSGDLQITNNLVYSGAYPTAADVPRVIYVVDGNIVVADGVTQIDAWLISNKTLFTCASDADTALGPLTLATCDQPLRFNGPVTVAKTRLSRTFGADASALSRTQAAETFNLAPNNFVSGFNTSISATNIQTVYEKELPPRY